MKKAVIIVAIIIGTLILGAVLLLILKPSQPSPPRKISTTQELDLYLEEITSNSTPPSLSIAVLKDGKWVYKKAFGMADIPRNIPARTTTVYPWYSATKLFTSTAVLKLVDEEKLSLGDPVKKYLPAYNTVNKDGESVTITVEQLLNHESGLPEIIPEGLKWLHFASEAPVVQSEFFENRIKEDYRVVNFTPGSDTSYSNTGYIVLGVIIEKITGMSYENYVSENILKPLNLESTSFVRTAELQKRTATGSQPVIDIFTVLLRVYGDRGLLKQLVREKDNHRMWFEPVYTDYTPSTGLSGTAENLAKFGYFLMEAEGLEGQQIENKELLKEMQRPFTKNELERKYRKIKQFGYGLKVWKMTGSRVYGHSGGGPGYAAILAFVPEKNLVIAVNANDTNLKKIEILKAVMEIDW
ncbi:MULTISPECIES: serine hydrolase [unclassified Oceanispirochaeta]|uniref:serine hydrolase domain-containing protein n=1 Tax=unclassified Oceanispirochaeta TaxID=2635722 RepID=UPI000E0902C4|nr:MULTISPECIES: serine hydrolase domain-containing protein [unclassified Oceanispirochaeta]MBF9016863.1 beta-lactamase family protein [Oceanispirochaeta sp. M2]NPD73226.1 beta-lactamase family protein [Oceanispirochaeta sp. M1]RDG31092.1 class A beta-lactamase-related serine hydrolase [Oceanispirochaeta sp. M1]